VESKVNREGLESDGVGRLSCTLCSTQCLKLFIVHSSVWRTTGPLPQWKRVRHRGRCSVFPFNFQYPLFSLVSSRSGLCLPPQLSSPSIFFTLFL